VALETAEDAIEAAPFDPEPAFQDLNHVLNRHNFSGAWDPPRKYRELSCQVLSRRSEFHAALEVRVEDLPVHISQRPLMEPALPARSFCRGEMIRRSEGISHCV
jgi:hypothetical protein